MDNLVPGEYTITEDISKNPTGIRLLGENDKVVEVVAHNTTSVPTAEFTNNYVYTDTELEATKSINYWGKAESFEFTLTAVDGAPMPESASDGKVTVVVDKQTEEFKAKFGMIEYTSPGTYKYIITETVPDDAVNASGKKYSEATAEEKTAGGFKYNGITYDSTIHNVVVSVEENQDGELNIPVWRSHLFRMMVPL